MRVIIEIISGPDAGRKVLLSAAQSLQVGRTDRADFSVPGDGRISGLHFALETDAETCRLRDLGSTNGTQLNGAPITAAVALHTGDTIQAGETLFAVDIEGDAPRQALSAAQPFAEAIGPVGVAADDRAAVALPERQKVEFSVETCASGLTLCRGSIAAMAPQRLAVLLSRSLMPYLIVDFRNLGLARPEELTQPDYLFDWLDSQVAAMVSPVIVSQADLLTWPDLVAQGWGKDAVVGLFSGLEKPSLLAHLREVVRVKGKPPNQGGAILGYCWPGVLSMLLAHHTPAFVSRLMDGIEAVLVEFADLPETWQVFGRPPLVDALTRLGFVPQAARGD